MSRFVAAILLPAGLALLAEWMTPARATSPAAPLGVFIILGCGAMAVFDEAPSLRALLRLALALGVGTAAAFVLARSAALPSETAVSAAAIVFGALAVPAALSAPIRVALGRSIGRAALLLVAAAMLATPWILPDPRANGGAASGYAPVPDWVACWNPLARLHGSLLPEDWFHAPALYPRVGERAYTYPDWDAALGPPLLLAGGAFALSLVLAPTIKRVAEHRAKSPGA